MEQNVCAIVCSLKFLSCLGFTYLFLFVCKNMLEKGSLKSL